MSRDISIFQDGKNYYVSLRNYLCTEFIIISSAKL